MPPAASRSCPNRGRRTPTSPAGSASAPRARRSGPSSSSGAAGWPASRRWPCRPTTASHRAGRAEGYVAPRDELEQELAAIWERALGVRPIGVDGSFFHLGGHSLIAVQVFNEIERSIGERLPLSTLFQAPTIGRLAEVLREN
jgi:acyl carrier protein